MEAVLDFEQLCGTQNETVVKELSIAGHNVFETFQFQIPYAMRPHGNRENGLNWDDGHIPYNQLSSVLNEAVAGFAHLYAYGDSKCTWISQLLGRPVHNLEDFTALRPATSDLNSVVPNPVTEIPRSVALIDTRIPFTSG